MALFPCTQVAAASAWLSEVRRSKYHHSPMDTATTRTAAMAPINPLLTPQLLPPLRCDRCQLPVSNSDPEPDSEPGAESASQPSLSSGSFGLPDPDALCLPMCCRDPSDPV
ncbi:Uncharacterised protein [Mycobacteroides abscessus subsp. abscessus]|nr:Uncharacterised protein [Mycobacteroides abscessus subsp. abscessus]